MTDSTWLTGLKALGLFFGTWLPQRLILWRWPAKRILDHVDVFASGTPRFYTGAHRQDAVLQSLVFNVHNLTPINLKLVGLEVEVSVNSTRLFRYERRFVSEIPAAPYTRSGFHIQHELTDAQARAVKGLPAQWVLTRASGYLVMKSVVGEYRREVFADVVALIDPEERSRPEPRLAASR